MIVLIVFNFLLIKNFRQKLFLKEELNKENKLSKNMKIQGRK